MCQTTAPLTKKSSHLLWNAFSQWLPLGLASVEVKVWCLITFGGAIFSSSFQLSRGKKTPSPQSPIDQKESLVFLVQSFGSFSFGFSNVSADVRLWKVWLWCNFFKGQKWSFFHFSSSKMASWNTCVRSPLRATEKLSTENESLQDKVTHPFCTKRACWAF